MKLPVWAPTIRPNQVTALQGILDAYNSTDVVILEAPTGAGKTLIADLVRQSLNSRTIYSCSSISLQHQFLRDFPTAALLKGRSNYPTLDHPKQFTAKFSQKVSCADCDKKRDSEGDWECHQCSSVYRCPYELAKSEAVRSDLVCLNTHYFLYECNYSGAMRNRDLVIVDECDLLEEILLSFIQVSISPKQIEHYALPRPSKKTVQQSWIEWSGECYASLQSQLKRLERILSPYPTLTEIRELKSLNNLCGDFARLVNRENGLESGNWVYDGYGEGHIIFKPISVAPYGNQYLWQWGKRWLLMSATIISADELATSLGIGS
jgi:Rad3-related DNA helicase